MTAVRDDRLLTKIGVAKALRSMAAIAAGIHDPDAALLWCESQGFIAPKPGGARNEIVLTQRGASAVWLFWKAVKTAMAANRGERVDESEWSKTAEGESVTLDDPQIEAA